MAFIPDTYLGIDPTAGRNPYTWAMLDAEGRLVVLGGGELKDVLSLADRQGSTLVAVNAPSQPNRGLVREKLAGEQASARIRGADMRLAEHVLRTHGISVPPTPSKPEISPAWIQMGFLLHGELEQLGYALHPNDKDTRQRFETNPHAVFCALLEKVPLPKPTLEGRLQRQLVLHESVGNITDPMEFFEEITRYKLLHGILPMEFIYTAEELDALAAVLAAWLMINRPDEITAVGDETEGQIFLPVKKLNDHYN